MNADDYIKPGAIVPITHDSIRELVALARQQQAEIEALKRKIAILDHCLDGAY